ncbi:AAA family ATPase [Methylorubrum extorquens]|uniref:AAA family ATPase n=1 Tax=Methylorubrum extorquens TaxID=408 RepID=UPI001FCCA74E|nr:AAA family ATPase [Methylorubrum extorquens]
MRLALEAIKQDARAGGERFRILMPDATDPVPRLHGFLYWLRRYASFSKGEPVDADDDPIVLFDGTGKSFKPVRMRSRTSGVEAYRIKPEGASNETEDAIEEQDIVAVARALLIDGRAVRIREAGINGTSYFKFPGRLVAYRLRPDMAEALGLPIEGGSHPPVTQAETPEPLPMPPPTNLILYGPPGTGKTYRTAAEAVRLCDGATPDTREGTMARYRGLVEAGQIRFVTFHQSYAYEDFVEGLRPETGTSEDGTGFRLEPRRGIFREIATLAEQARKKGSPSAPFDLAGRHVYKMSLGRAGSEDHIYEAAILGGYAVLGWGGSENWSDQRYENYQAVFDRWNQIEPGTSGNSGNIVQLWRFRSMQVGDLIVVSDGNLRFRAIGEVTGPYRYDPTDVGDYPHRRDVRWLLVLKEPLPVEEISDKRFSQVSCYLLADEHLKREALARLLPGAPAATGLASPDQFVLVIDEINRANISKVFGELITLIEPDKRLGRPGEITVRLPASGDSFGIPDNLHIVGTMNTADRSIALLDTALRRRFSFVELMPDPGLLAEAGERCGVDLVALLTGINARIEYLFDREHQIGHAYFMHCASRTDVDDVMRHRVIPLLAEYFYEDWGKVALALGDPKGERFLERTALKPPAGLAEEGAEERARWTVRRPFDSGAYQVYA